MKKSYPAGLCCGGRFFDYETRFSLWKFLIQTLRFRLWHRKEFFPIRIPTPISIPKNFEKERDRLERKSDPKQNLFFHKETLTMEGRELYLELRLDFNTSESTHWDIQNPKVWRAHIQPLWEYMNSGGARGWSGGNEPPPPYFFKVSKNNWYHKTSLSELQRFSFSF